MMKDLWPTIKETVDEFLNDKVLRLSAALAYYSIFSIAPLLLIAVSIAGFVFGDDAANGLLENQLRDSMGPAAAEAVQDMVAHTRQPAENFVASLVGVGLLIVGAGGLFGQLQDALNAVWGIAPKPGRGWKGLLRDRFLSFSMVLGTGFLLLTSLILSTVLHAANDTISQIVPIHPAILGFLSNVVSFAVVASLFAAIFKVLPDAEIAWHDVRGGAIVTACLFVIGKMGLSWYLGREATASSYGSAGSLVLILLWVYYSSTILLFGAEYTQVRARIRGRQIGPSKGAVRMQKPRVL